MPPHTHRLRWIGHRLIRLSLFFGFVLCIFPLTHLLIMLWGDLFSARLLAQRMLPSPIAGIEVDFDPEDPFTQDLWFISTHARTGWHTHDDYAGYDTTYEGETFSGLSVDIVDSSLWHGVRLMALADDLDGIHHLILDWVQLVQQPQTLSSDVVVALRGDPHPFNRQNLGLFADRHLSALAELFGHIYADPVSHGSSVANYGSWENRIRAGGALVRALDLDQGLVPEIFHKIALAEVMLEINQEEDFYPRLDIQGYLAPNGGLEGVWKHYRRPPSGQSCPFGFFYALQGFSEEFPRTSLEDAMRLILDAEKACSSVPIAVDWLRYMGAQTLHRQVWQIDAALFSTCPSERAPLAHVPYPTIRLQHLFDLEDCDELAQLEQFPINLEGFEARIFDGNMEVATNLQNDMDYIRSKLKLYRDLGLVLP